MKMGCGRQNLRRGLFLLTLDLQGQGIASNFIALKAMPES